MKREVVDVDQPAEGGGINTPSIKIILLLLLAVAVLIFFLQNGETAEVQFLGFDVTWPLRSVIIISVAAGVVLDRLFTWQWRRAKRRKAKQSAE